MKKMFLVAAVALVASLASCSGNKQAEDKGADLKSKIENCTNPDSLKAYVQQAQDYARQLISEGKDSEAKAYLDEIVPAVTAKDPSLVTKLVSEADSAATALKDKAAAAGDSINAKASELKDSVASKATKAVESTKQAAKDAADATKDAAGKAKDAAAGAISNGADKVKEALGGK